MHPDRIRIGIAVRIQLNVYAEIAAEPVHRLRVEGHVYRHDVPVRAYGDKQHMAVTALKFQAYLRVS